MLPIDIPGYYPGKLKGDFVAISVDGYRFDCETQCSFNFDREYIAINAQQNGYFARYRPGKMTWGMDATVFASMASQYGDFKHIINKMKMGSPVQIEFGTITGVEPYWRVTGEAFGKNVTVSANIGEYLSASINFIGSGAFNTDWNQFALVINAMPAEDDKPIYIESFNWD